MQSNVSPQVRVASQRRVVVLGSTGSIGVQTLDVARRHPDRLKIVGLAAGTRGTELLAQAKEFNVGHLALGKPEEVSASVVAELEEQAAGFVGAKGSIGFGSDAVREMVHLEEADVVVNALVGAAGLQASYETLRAGKVLALANKESLVVGGNLTIYQCLLGEDSREVSKLWVTASGGPFRGKKRSDLEDITPAQALAHPTWNMGKKISIDSSTLMNKGLEVIEAHHLFQMPYDRIEVVVQPQSAIHSMVEFTDGSVKAHLGTTDMRIPIQFALSYPERWDAPVEPLDFRMLGSLDFAAPDTETFRCLALAYHAGRVSGTLPCAMNAANEVAVASFLEEKLPYLGIAECVEAVMSQHEARGVQQVMSIEQLLEVDAWARSCARAWVSAR